MAVINLLDKKVYNRISAGEVVERPASVIKELVENSIDAGATEIIVSIERGGMSAISVRDNGSGIEKTELAKAFLPHATSKIVRAEDLDNILFKTKSNYAGMEMEKYYYHERNGNITITVIGDLEVSYSRSYLVRLVFEGIKEYEEDQIGNIDYIYLYKLASGEYFAQIGCVSEFKFERCYVEKVFKEM